VSENEVFMMTGRVVMFLLHDKVVYPGYGVAVIHQLVSRMVSGKQTTFYMLKFFNKKMTILVPETKLENVGIRSLCSEQELQKIFMILSEYDLDSILKYYQNIANWNRRYKEYQAKLRSGDLAEMAKIYRDLKIIATKKDLSFGERNLLAQIELLLSEEISNVKGVTNEQSLLMLQEPFDKLVACAALALEQEMTVQ
jgi:CarD family transcriptional regulator